MSETHLVLIRHGHSLAQAEGRVPSHLKCRGLSELGRRQVSALGERLESSGELSNVGVVLTSLSLRAVETAEMLTGVLPKPSDPECGWCESHPGEAEGILWSEFNERFPRRDGVSNPFERRIPGGESWAEFYARVGARLRRVPADHPGQHVVVATHGGVVGASFVALGDTPIGKAAVLTDEVTNASLTEWRYRNGEWRLLRFNDAAHLH